MCTIKKRSFYFKHDRRTRVSESLDCGKNTIKISLQVAFYTLSHGKIWHSTKLCSWQIRPSAVGKTGHSEKFGMWQTRHSEKLVLKKLDTQQNLAFAEILHSANSAFGEILHSEKNLALGKLGIWQTAHITNMKFAEYIDYI